MHTRTTLSAILLALAVVCTAPAAYAQSRPVHVSSPRWASAPAHVVSWNNQHGRFERAILRFEEAERILAQVDASARYAEVSSADRLLHEAHQLLAEAEHILRGRGRVSDFDATVDRAIRLARDADRAINSAISETRHLATQASHALLHARTLTSSRPGTHAYRLYQRAVDANREGERDQANGRLGRAQRQYRDAIVLAEQARDAVFDIRSHHTPAPPAFHAPPHNDRRDDRRDDRRNDRGRNDRRDDRHGRDRDDRGGNGRR